MRIFETRIVKTWQPSKWLRTIGIILLIASAITVFSWRPEIPWLLNSSYLVYAITFLFALSLSLIKPKNLGEIVVSEDAVKVKMDQSERIFQMNNLKEIGLNNKGYASFWRNTIEGNKMHFYFMDQDGEKFDYEILIQNKEEEEELKRYLENLEKISPVTA